MVLEQSDLPGDTYKISSDVSSKSKTGSKQGKLVSKKSMDTERSSKEQQTNVRTGEKRTMTNIVGDFNKTKKIGNLTTGNKKVSYYVDATESEGADKDYFFYHMYIGKESKLKKTDVKISMTNHPNSKKPGKITYEVGKSGNFKPASALKAILKLKLMGVKPKELIDILKNLNPNVDIAELETAMKKAINHKAEDYKNIKEVKITRSQLRKLLYEFINLY